MAKLIVWGLALCETKINDKGLMLETSASLYCVTFDQQNTTVSLETRPFPVIIIIFSLSCFINL